jgi:succinate dehydrogenase / fumarate reductase membrane anchor subunit
MTSYRTPRSRAAGLGSAKHGVGVWIAERVSAIALVPLSLWAVFAVLTVAPLGYEGAVLWLQSPVNLTLSVLFAAISFYHMGMGLKVVIEDYIHTRGALIGLLLLNAFVWFGVGVWTIVSLFKVAMVTQVGVVF